MANTRGNAVVAYNSTLRRKEWVREGMVENRHSSIFSPIKGSTFQSIVVVKNLMGANQGNLITFDWDGALSGRSIPGTEQAFGKGEQKIKFSQELRVGEQILVVQEDRKFQAHEIAASYLSDHEHSRSLLLDLHSRWSDQALCDTFQSLTGTDPSHKVDLTTFDVDDVTDLANIAKTGRGFTSPAAGIRAPLTPFRTTDKAVINARESYFLMFVDTPMVTALKKDAKFQNIYSNATPRGNDNQVVSGVIGKIGLMYIVEMPTFFGSMLDTATSTPIKFSDTRVEVPGFRSKDAAGKWAGMKGWDSTTKQTSRAVIVGAGAVQMGMGMEPDFKIESTDFGRNTESGLEFWPGYQKTRLYLEKGDQRAMAKVNDMDLSIITVDYTPA